MTTLCAYQDPQTSEIWIGSDQQLTCGIIKESVRFPKWTTPDLYHTEFSWVFGVSGEPAVLSIASDAMLDYQHAHAPKISPHDVTARGVAEAIRKRLSQIDWSADRGNGEPPHRNTTVLMVLGSRMYELDIATGWALYLHPGEFITCGSGMELALGAGEALRDNHPEKRIRRALEIAIQYDVNSGGEPWISKLC